MTAYTPLTPISLAVAMELQRRAQANPEITILEALQGLLEDRPNLDLQGAKPVCAQINDLMDVTAPPPDRARMVLMVALPGNTGVLFTASEILLSDVKLLPRSPVLHMAAKLAASMDQSWEEFRKAVCSIPVTEPNRIVGANGIPFDRRPAAGPTPAQLKDFLPGGRP